MNKQNANEKKKVKWIGAAIALMFLVPGLIPVALLGGVLWYVFKYANKQQATPKSDSRHYTTRQKSFDECPQSLFCRHSDKTEHHIRRGKEIDPWDRPDIDISKYQRRN